MNHDKDHVFTQEELLGLTPEHLVRYMSMKVFGVPEPEEDANPMEGRSSSLEYYKKAVSYFMPNKLMTWDVQTGRGNPTCLVKVNELIKLVKKKEVWKQGKESSARRSMEQSEYIKVIKRFCLSNQPLDRFVLSSYFIFQYNSTINTTPKL